MTKKTNEVKTNVNNETINYGFYSKVLNKPFDSLSELMAAETAYQREQKSKEDKAAQKKADAQKVEEAIKAVNAARREYRDKLNQLTKEYSEELTNLKKAFDLGKKDLANTLATAEQACDKALKEFTSKYDQYHMTIKDGDLETTISGNTKVNSTEDLPKANSILDIFDWLFKL